MVLPFDVVPRVALRVVVVDGLLDRVPRALFGHLTNSTAWRSFVPPEVGGHATDPCPAGGPYLAPATGHPASGAGLARRGMENRGRRERRRPTGEARDGHRQTGPSFEATLSARAHGSRDLLVSAGTWRRSGKPRGRKKKAHTSDAVPWSEELPILGGRSFIVGRASLAAMGRGASCWCRRRPGSRSAGARTRRRSWGQVPMKSMTTPPGSENARGPRSTTKRFAEGPWGATIGHRYDGSLVAALTYVTVMPGQAGCERMMPATRPHPSITFRPRSDEIKRTPRR